MGMLEIFDALAVTGNNSARTTAGGVSKATVSTMAGMVVAISGLMISNYLIDKAKAMKLRFQENLSANELKDVSHA
ncbi:MAG: biopolymer transport protein ExbB [Glaciecola sp.]|jgi:biopolymer transport protein ExbB